MTRNLKKFLKKMIPLILAILIIAGVSALVVWTCENNSTSIEDELMTDIFAHDYIRIDGIDYPTKDISRIQFGYDASYGYMTLNDEQVIVRFNCGEFVLYNEGGFPYGTGVS